MADPTTTIPGTDPESKPADQEAQRAIPRQVHVLIPAAGRGVRYGTAENKVFALLAGRPVIARTVQVFLSSATVDTVTVIGRAEDLPRLRELLANHAPSQKQSFCEGGASRQESVSRGLADIVRRGASHDDLVLVHDAARPLVTPALIERCIAASDSYGAAVAAYPLVDTIKRVSPDSLLVEQTVPRENLWTAQTPQCASVRLLREASDHAAELAIQATDEASLLERIAHPPIVVMGERSNIKITTQDDLAFAETLLFARLPDASSTPLVRVGIGYDIHQLVSDRRLVLGGVEIAHPRGLLGHSDADVVLHAICDALLGAAALPDIGHLFPNDDPRYKNADSLHLLSAVRSAVVDAGYAVGNVDACVIAEEPKIASHVPAMKRAIALALEIDENAVSVKATTNEKIGSLGAGEGIACHATALIYSTR